MSPLTRFLPVIQRRLFAAIALLLAGLAVYAPALSGEFIWDDHYLVGGNPFFKSPVFVLEVFRQFLFLDSFSLYYRPVQNLSYMVDYWLWNQNSFGYHLSNVLFHVTSGFLVFLLLRKLIAQLLAKNQRDSQVPGVAAFLVALVWVIHPIHNAAVAYISGRADSLACLFAVGAWLLWLEAWRFSSLPKRCALWAGAAFLILVALCAKEIAFVWIGLFCVHLLFFETDRGVKSKAAAITSLLAILVGYWCLRHLPGARVQPIGDAPPALAARTLLMLRALGDYVTLLFFPITLHMERTVFQAGYYRSFSFWQSNVWFEYLSLIGASALAAGSWLCFQESHGQKLRRFGAVWFLLGFLPISNLFPLNAQCAEHWIYMPSIGFLVFLAGCLLALPVRLQATSVWVILLAASLLGVRTAERSEDWSGVEKFLTRTVLDGGGTCRIYVNLAAERLKRGDTVTAEKMLRDTLQRFPQYSPARISLGMVLLREGRRDEAEKYLSFSKTEADELAHSFPDTYQAALNLAHIHEQAGDKLAALRVLDEAIALYPEVWELVRLKASLIQQTQGAAAAVTLVQAYTKTHWWHYDAFLNLGRLQSLADDPDAALGSLRHAARLDIHSVDPLNHIARIELGLKHPQLALESQQRAVRREAGQPTQYVLLAVILDELGRAQEASAAMAEAERLRSETKS